MITIQPNNISWVTPFAKSVKNDSHMFFPMAYMENNQYPNIYRRLKIEVGRTKGRGPSPTPNVSCR